MRPGDIYRGGGAREQQPGTEEWMRLEAQPFHKNAFAQIAAAWKRQNKGVPFYAWPMLAAAVLAISSAGAAFEEMPEVATTTLAAWRLQLSAVLLFFGAVWQWHREMDREQRLRVLRSWQLLTFSGVCLAMHFGFWVWSLDHTSLTHSLLLVCSTPVLIAVGTWVLRKPITKVEMLGCLAGFSGGLLLALGPKGKDEGKVTLIGDAAALSAACFFIGYLLAGRRLRQWMPIFVYAFPVTAVAALLLTLAALLLDGAGLLVAGQGGMFGWLASKQYAPFVVYLGIVPGIIGHTGFNTLLRYLTPLTVSLAFQLEPLFGSLIGWAAGEVAAPGWATWIGGSIVLAATCVVTAANAQREQVQEARGQAVVELENVFLSEQQGLLTADQDMSDFKDDEFTNGTGRNTGAKGFDSTYSRLDAPKTTYLSTAKQHLQRHRHSEQDILLQPIEEKTSHDGEKQHKQQPTFVLDEFDEELGHVGDTKS